MKLPEGWKSRPLVSCTEDKVISYGIVQPGRHVEDGIPIVRVNNFTKNGLDLSSVLRVSQEIEGKFLRTRLRGGEVLLTLVGSIGQSVVVPEELFGWNVARAVAVIRPYQEVGAAWINICLGSQSTADFIDARANTTVQKTLNIQDVRQIEIPIPPTHVKDFITQAIGSLDDKIELNRQMNATLEAMAQALFQSWFVDFDPVIDKALAAGNPIPEPLQQRAHLRRELGEKRKPLPADVARHFPDRFVFTEELGWVPEGWEVVPIKELCLSVQNGATPKRMVSEYWDNGIINWFKTGELTDSILLNSEERISAVGLAKSSCKLWPIGTVLIAIYAAPTVGRLGILTEESCSNQACTGLVPKAKVGPYFIFRALLNAREWLNTVAVGAAQQNISKAVVEGVPTVRVCNALYSAFNELVGPFSKQIEAKAKESVALSSLRDTLLPKLLSGELRVPDAERLVEGAL